MEINRNGNGIEYRKHNYKKPVKTITYGATAVFFVIGKKSGRKCFDSFEGRSLNLSNYIFSSSRHKACYGI